jgi:hypothetical protein
MPAVWRLGQTLNVTLPSGTSGQTLRHDGTNWVANSNLFHNGSAVGLGITSPQSLLHLHSTGTVTDIQLTTAASGSTIADGLAIYYRADGAHFNNQENSALHFYSNNAERITVAAGGNVGIGVTNPNAAKLEVAGQVKITGGTPGAGKVLVSDATGLASWQTAVGGGTLDNAYDFGGAGAGRTIVADNGAVKVTGTDGLLVTGTHGSGDDIEISGAGTRMFFNPKKSAFRAGHVDNDSWDSNNVGVYSTAIGNRTLASGTYSVAFGGRTSATNSFAFVAGSDNEASGWSSTCFGNDATASGDYSTAMGSETTASGNGSTAMGRISTASGTASFSVGYGAVASGYYSMSLGYSTRARASGEVAIGHFNTDYAAGSSINPTVGTDRVFVVGNGSSDSNRSNAVVVLKSGNTAIGNIDPTTKLDVDGQVRIRGGAPGLNKILASDAVGLASWVSANSLLPSGTSGQTMRHDGTDWVANSNLFNNGTGVGIGTASIPAESRLVLGAMDATNEGGQLQINAPGGSHTTAYFIDNYQNRLRFMHGTNAGSTAPRMAIDNNGNLGIATSDPNERLEVSSGNVANVGRMVVSNGGAASRKGLLLTSPSNSQAYARLESYDYAGAGTGMPLIINNVGGGAVGIGLTAPQSRFHLHSSTTVSDIQLTTSETGMGVLDGLSIYYMTGGAHINNQENTPLQFHTNNSPRMTISAAGNVGIGVTNPTAARLEVAGQVKINGGAPGAGKVLVSDATGLASWQTFASGGTLDDAYDFGGAGAGRTIDASSGAVEIAGKDGFLATGTLGQGSLPATGDGVRMMWYPNKAAFRAGQVNNGTGAWEDAEIGNQSFAGGLNTIASGSYSTAFGNASRASGLNSTALAGGQAIGNSSLAIGWANALGGTSFAMGDNVTAERVGSVAAGYLNRSRGDYSAAFGVGNRAKAYGSFTAGVYNDTTDTPNASSSAAGDRVFQIGNGTAHNARSTALTVFRNGDVKIGQKGTGLTNLQEGQLTAGTQAGNNKKAVTLTFPNEFTNAANVRVLLTPVNEGTFNDVFIVSVRSITATNCVVEIFRADVVSGTGWGQDLKVNWMAWE